MKVKIKIIKTKKEPLKLKKAEILKEIEELIKKIEITDFELIPLLGSICYFGRVMCLWFKVKNKYLKTEMLKNYLFIWILSAFTILYLCISVNFIMNYFSIWSLKKIKNKVSSINND